MTRAAEGLLLVDKPSGMTSHDAVDVVRRSLGTRKVGHAGTLDPMATGLLVLGVGRATRLLRYLGDLPKTYAATGRLGEETDTLDADGEIVRTAPVDVSLGEVERACASLVGESMQTPPAYSAVKVGGRKLYEAARKGTKQQIAFYGSTPAYRPVLEIHGWGGLQEELNGLSKQGEWVQMGKLIDRHLAERGIATRFLHGRVPAARRQEW